MQLKPYHAARNKALDAIFLDKFIVDIDVFYSRLLLDHNSYGRTFGHLTMLRQYQRTLRLIDKMKANQ